MVVDVNENSIQLKFRDAYAKLITCYYRLEKVVNVEASVETWLQLFTFSFSFFKKEKKKLGKV